MLIKQGNGWPHWIGTFCVDKTGFLRSDHVWQHVLIIHGCQLSSVYAIDGNARGKDAPWLAAGKALETSYKCGLHLC